MTKQCLARETVHVSNCSSCIAGTSSAPRLSLTSYSSWMPASPFLHLHLVDNPEVYDQLALEKLLETTQKRQQSQPIGMHHLAPCWINWLWDAEANGAEVDVQHFLLWLPDYCDRPAILGIAKNSTLASVIPSSVGLLFELLVYPGSSACLAETLPPTFDESWGGMFFGLYRLCFDKNGLAYDENGHYLDEVLKVFYNEECAQMPRYL